MNARTGVWWKKSYHSQPRSSRPDVLFNAEDAERAEDAETPE
jgi:hypothetical protein